MGGRRARDDEVARWREHGWVLLEGLVPAEEIDAAVGDLYALFPTAQEYHADPEGETERRLGRPAPVDEFPWPAQGPGFRRDQHRWMGAFPFPGSGLLNRLVVHPSIVDFAVRALGSTDVRLYQAQVSAKYTGITNYEQPMHTDRNHSWLPAVRAGAMVACRGIPLSLRRRARLRPHPPGVRARVGGAADDGTARDARPGPGAVCRRAGRRRCAGLVPRLSLRRLPSGRRPHRARRCPVPPQRELQARRPGLGGLPHHAVARRPRPTGWRSSRRRHLPSWRCSGSRLPGIPIWSTAAPRRHTTPVPRARHDPVAIPARDLRRAIPGPGRRRREAPPPGFSAIRQEDPVVLEPDNCRVDPGRERGVVTGRSSWREGWSRMRQTRRCVVLVGALGMLAAACSSASGLGGFGLVGDLDKRRPAVGLWRQAR